MNTVRVATGRGRPHFKMYPGSLDCWCGATREPCRNCGQHEVAYHNVVDMRVGDAPKMMAYSTYLEPAEAFIALG